VGFIVHRAAGSHTLLRQVSGETLRIGRDAGAELRLDDDAVAFDHAVIRAVTGGWTLEDRGSVTGTYLGGRRVTSTKLAAGDVIEIGGFRIRVQITDPEDPLFVHVQAVGAGAAEAPRPARGSATGSLRLDELVARARASGRGPPPAAADTGPLRRLAEIAAAAEAEATARAGAERAAEGAGAGRKARQAPEAETAAVETAAVEIAPPAPSAAAAAASGAAPEPSTAPEAPAASEPSTAPVPRPAAPAARTAGTVASGAPAAVPRIDYAAAYSLRRPGLTKGLATLAATLLAAAALAALDASGSRTWLMPGISSAHARVVGAAGAEAPAGSPGSAPPRAAGAPPSATGAVPGAVPAAGPLEAPGAGPSGAGASGAGPSSAGASGAGPSAASLAIRRGEVAERGCLACHRPWRGPAAVEGCAGCHPGEGAPHAALLAGSASVPACAACHPEHRGRALVAAADERPCLACHGDLGAIETTAEPAVARRVTSFAAEHPELVIALPAAGGGVRRLRLDDPAARAADPAVLRFGHRFHQVHEEGEAMAGPPLKPTTGIAAAEIEARLRCGTCHEPDPASGLMRPVDFERHCQACHGLGFDAERFPDCQVPHQAPAEVEGFLLLTFVQRECAAAGAGAGGRSLAARRTAERVRALAMISGDDPRRRQFQVQVDRAMAKVFASECAHCHAVDLDAEPRPAVEPPWIPASWMPGARFSHLDHEGIACAGCHAGAAASERTADVLMPGIAACRSCHGEDRAAPGASRLLTCGECHDYHRTEAAR
jgi:hypothetical protein